MAQLPALVGVDTGGTFTDLVAVIGREVRCHKVRSTPHNPAVAVLRGLRELLVGVHPEVITYGSTVATNAILERSGARVVLLTTAGFEDVVEIGRQDRPVLYDLEPQRPEPLVPRRRRVGVAERMTYSGEVVLPLSRRAARTAVAAVARLRADAVAVCLLHSYANARHERLLGAALAHLPHVYCSLSHALVPEYREYERLSTTVINAYVGPVMSGHLGDLQRGLRSGAQGDSPPRLRVMQSNGGAISAPLAGREAVRTVLSGPAGGVIGAWSVAQALGIRRVITFDMGGTSTDVSLLDGGPIFRSDWTIGGLPLKVPALDIHTVGAGGGSIAWMDEGGALKVGPQSAGADPGPACYGKGRVPTVTDANVLLGRLIPDAFLGGRLALQPQRAQAAVTALAARLRLPADATAEGIVRVVNASMERAIRTVSVERGHDPREYTLIAFGGAAGLHACELGLALGIRRVLLPVNPGLLSAWGAIFADVQRDYVRTVLMTNPLPGQLRRSFAALEALAVNDLRREGVRAADCRIIRGVDVRYRGQSYEISLPHTARITEAFHRAHQRLYGYADRDRPVEVVNIRVRAVGRHRRRPQPPQTVRRGTGVRAHAVRWQGAWRRCPAHERTGLTTGIVLRGPAVITEFSATTFVPPGWTATMHRGGHLLLAYHG